MLSATTGELVWECTSISFWHMRGWELRGWLCEAIHCAQHFSVVLLARQLLLCDMATSADMQMALSLQCICYVVASLTQRPLICNRPPMPYAPAIEAGYGQFCREGFI